METAFITMEDKLHFDVTSPVKSFDELKKPTEQAPNEHKMAEQKPLDSTDFNTARFYKMNEGIIEESFAFLDNQPVDTYYLSNRTTKNKDIVLVLSGKESDQEIDYLSDTLKTRLHTIIYSNNITVNQTLKSNASQIIETGSFRQSVNESYRIVENGQTILFPRTNSVFDFFSFI